MERENDKINIFFTSQHFDFAFDVFKIFFARRDLFTFGQMEQNAKYFSSRIYRIAFQR